MDWIKFILIILVELIYGRIMYKYGEIKMIDKILNYEKNEKRSLTEMYEEFKNEKQSGF